jgi:hypothetical protein
MLFAIVALVALRSQIEPIMCVSSGGVGPRLRRSRRLARAHRDSVTARWPLARLEPPCVT